MTGEIKGPQRAFTLTLRFGADTEADLVMSLVHLAQQIERGEATTGVFGSPSVGGEYELLAIDKTHEEYFAELDAYLAERRAARECHSESKTL